MLPHQGVVALTVSLLSLAITLGFLVANLYQEKKYQASNHQDEH